MWPCRVATIKLFSEQIVGRHVDKLRHPVARLPGLPSRFWTRESIILAELERLRNSHPEQHGTPWLYTSGAPARIATPSTRPPRASRWSYLMPAVNGSSLGQMNRVSGTEHAALRDRHLLTQIRCQVVRRTACCFRFRLFRAVERCEVGDSPV